MFRKFKTKRTFLQKFEDIAKEKGFDTISNFVDDWVAKGGNFRTLHDLVSLNDINVNRYTVWLNLRKYLTIPYDGEDAFWYKWNALAKTKGKETISDWMRDCGKDLTTLEISRELAVNIRHIEKLIVRINKLNNKETKRFRKTKDSDGFAMTNVKEKWLKRVNEKGYKTLREAITDMDGKGMGIYAIAKEFGVTKRVMKLRIDRANIELTSDERGKIATHA